MKRFRPLGYDRVSRGYHQRYHFWITPLRDKLGKSIGWRGVILFPSPAPHLARLLAERVAPQFTFDCMQPVIK
ncbi:hypothetical protein XAC3218_800012 [Xanthomonas citri pv. citri]|nr:hypothetical protein XAC3218_800012 [Xanthomonas citri pv. citri]CEI11960.1 hypothetical protein XACB302_7250011 [Xanthomonas citri pv. citri]